MNTTKGELIAVAVAAIITLLVPICATIIVFVIALCLPLLGGTTAHDSHLSSLADLFRFRNLIFSTLSVLTQYRHILNLQL